MRYTHSDALSVDLQVKNLTGREYEYVWYDNFFWDVLTGPCFHRLLAVPPSFHLI